MVKVCCMLSKPYTDRHRKKKEIWKNFFFLLFDLKKPLRVNTVANYEHIQHENYQKLSPNPHCKIIMTIHSNKFCYVSQIQILFSLLPLEAYGFHKTSPSYSICFCYFCIFPWKIIQSNGLDFWTFLDIWPNHLHFVRFFT